MIRSLLLVMVIAISGCGGNSGGDSRSSSSHSISSVAMSSSQSSLQKEFGLHKLNSVTPGEVYTSRLEAVNSVGYTEVGRIWIANKEEELLNGILVTPRMIDFIHCSGDCSGSNSLFPRVAWAFTYYIETTTGNLISFKQLKQSSFSSEEVVLDCRSVSPSQMPSVIRPGDVGVTSGFNCGTIMLEGNSWSASAKGNDKIVLSIIYKGFGGIRSYNLDGIEEFEIQYTLDAEGNIVSVTAGGLSTSVAN